MHYVNILCIRNIMLFLSLQRHVLVTFNLTNIMLNPEELKHTHCIYTNSSSKNRSLSWEAGAKPSKYSKTLHWRLSKGQWPRVQWVLMEENVKNGKMVWTKHMISFLLFPVKRVASFGTLVLKWWRGPLSTVSQGC